MTRTTIPRWLYESDLPDDQLQAVYVKAARRKVAELEADPETPAGQLAQAKAFLAVAERRLRVYRRQLPDG